VSFASLDTPQATNLISRFSEAEDVTLIVGAGASVEASLPTWQELVERLLRRIARADRRLRSAESETAWVARTVESEGLLGAAAIVEAMAENDLAKLLPEALYGPKGAGAVEPGPIAHQVAHLRRCFGERLTILTTNYDDLIERALLAGGLAGGKIKSYVRQRTPPAGAVGVTHLHGYAGRGGGPKRLVLTESHYHRMQRGSSWQENLVTGQLEHTLCLFVGTSLNDPNLIRYLYGYGQSSTIRHAAVFVREGDLDDDNDEVRAARERAAAKRWGRCGVECLFVDHFADAAQLLYEIAHRHDAAGGYEPVAPRAAKAIARIDDLLILRDAGQQRFAERQIALSRRLRETLYGALELAIDRKSRGGERFALALWLLSRDGRSLTAWAHSDRAHQDPMTIEAVPIHPDSSWVAVRAVCQGVRVELDRDIDISRWRFIRALPLILDQPTRLPMGCLTIASTAPGGRSILTTVSEHARRALHRNLIETIKAELDAVVGLPGSTVRDGH
jgi:SIR2-like domain